MLPLPVLDGGHITLSLVEVDSPSSGQRSVREHHPDRFRHAAHRLHGLHHVLRHGRLDSQRARRPRSACDFRAGKINFYALLRIAVFFPSPQIPRNHHRRPAANGGVIIGGNHPVVIQSMITCDTMDTAASVQQTLDLVAVGCQIVRITAPTVKDAANLQNIVAELRQHNCLVPIVADIHFKPEAAMEAVKWVEVIRVNPGNYADSKKFAIKEYTDEQYRSRVEAHRGKVHAARPGMQAPQARHAHRHQSRLAVRPHHEPFRRFPAGHG